MVPDEVQVRKVKKARRHHAKAKELKPVPPKAEAEPAFEPPKPVPLFEIDMSATVDTGGVIVPVAPDGEGNPLARPGDRGERGVKGRPQGTPTYVPDVPLAESWEITSDAMPLNDGDFEPHYPSGAKASGREAIVIVALDINADGRVVKTVIIRSGGADFDAAAMAYCRKLRFDPAKADARAVATRIEWTVWFRYHNE